MIWITCLRLRPTRDSSLTSHKHLAWTGDSINRAVPVGVASRNV